MDCKIANSQQKIIFFIPHFDDELFLLPLLKKYKGFSKNWIFVYLTNSSLKDNDIYSKRESESERFFKKLGIEARSIQLGKILNIYDCELSYNLMDALCYIKETLSLDGRIIIAPAWEGGHPDHDAAYLLASAISREVNISSYVYPTYNGRGKKGKFFNVFDKLSDQKVIFEVNVSFLQSFEYFFLAFTCFPSQLGSWVGLAPVGFYSLMRKSRWFLYRQGLSQLVRPHSGDLSYERFGRISWEDFVSSIEKDFVGLLGYC